MRNLWLAYVTVMLIAFGAGMAIAGLPNRPAATTMTTTAAPAATTTATTTATTVTAATTTMAPPDPTTATEPPTDLAAQIEADFREADRLANEALQDPFDPDKEAAALERRTGLLQNVLRETLVEYRQSNWAIRANADVPATVQVEVPAELVAADADAAELQVCEVNSWILVEVGAGPNGADSIVDPSVVAFRTKVLLRRVEGVWLVEGRNIIGQWEEASECPAE